MRSPTSPLSSNRLAKKGEARHRRSRARCNTGISLTVFITENAAIFAALACGEPAVPAEFDPKYIGF